MIFVTTGTQEPFDRLVKAIDDFTLKMPELEIVAQVSKSKYKLSNVKFYEFLTPTQFEVLFSKADLIVSHAGMGTIISALVKSKPILIFPRLAKYGEHRNDHQLATAKAFEEFENVYTAYNEEELMFKLQFILKGGIAFRSQNGIGNFASTELIASIQCFINQRPYS